MEISHTKCKKKNIKLSNKMTICLLPDAQESILSNHPEA